MSKAHKAKLNKDIRVNFNTSSEIAYWSKKLQVSKEKLQLTFERFGYSMSETIRHFLQEGGSRRHSGI